MAVESPGFIFIQSGGETAERARRFIANAMGSRGGIQAAGDLAVTENGTPNMSVNVAGGTVFIPGTEPTATFQGSYFIENRGVLNVAIAAADATNPRKDLIVAKVQDAAYSGVSNVASIVALTGTPAASPAEPTIPVNAWVLAMVDVPALDTAITNSQITDRRTQQTGQLGRAAALGGVIVCTATTRPAHVEGRLIYETDTDRVYASNGSAWRLVNSDIASDTVLTSQTTTSTTYTDLTTAGPSVTVSLENGQKALGIIEAQSAVSAEGATACMYTLQVDGPSTSDLAAVDDNAIENGNLRFTPGTKHTLFVATASGAHTFIIKYKVIGAITGTFSRRRIVVMPQA